MKSINERSAAICTVSFRAPTNALQLPTAVTYRIDDPVTGAQVKAWTSITPAATVAIPMSSSDNRILDQAKTQEPRLLTVVAAYGETEEDQATAELAYAINNLRFLN